MAVRIGRPPDWRRNVVRELREAAPKAADALIRQARLGDVGAASAVLDMLDRLDPKKGGEKAEGQA